MSESLQMAIEYLKRHDRMNAEGKPLSAQHMDEVLRCERLLDSEGLTRHATKEPTDIEIYEDRVRRAKLAIHRAKQAYRSCDEAIATSERAIIPHRDAIQALFDQMIPHETEVRSHERYIIASTKDRTACKASIDSGKRQLQQLERELELEQGPHWRNHDGRRLRLVEMSDNHILNCLKICMRVHDGKRGWSGDLCRRYEMDAERMMSFAHMTQEAKRRGIKDSEWDLTV